jgi:hypothetical protein
MNNRIIKAFFKTAFFTIGIIACSISPADEALTPGGTWKIVFSSAEGPQGRALEVLTERIGFHLLRERHLAIPLVLPLEQDGGEPVKGKRDMIVIGRVQENATLRKYLGKDAEKIVPKNGYVIRTLHDGKRNVVLLAGDTPEAVLWAAFDFLDVQVPMMEGALAAPRGRYPGTFFRANKRDLAKFDKDKEKRIPIRTIVSAPQTPIRSVFSWGHEIDDYKATFREMARARFNRIIIWNNQRVINARDIIEEAHSWGIKVYWGFAWGWSLHCDKADIHNLKKMSDGIIDEWHRIWKPMGGDGIYFQSFTETDKQELAGRSIAEAVVELVNMTAKRIRAEAPETDIVFGLHSNSIKKPGATDFIAKTDPSIEILWENCGGFPFWDGEGKTGGPNNKFCEKILALNPSVGLCWKAQLYLDWKNWVEPAGPFMLGCAGRKLWQHHQSIMAPMHWQFDNDWLQNGKFAWESIRRLRAYKNPPKEFNIVPYANPPFNFSMFCTAELFWNSDDPWDKIMLRARLRALPER